MVMSFGMAESVSSCNIYTFHQKIRLAERVCVWEREIERKTDREKERITDLQTDQLRERERERERVLDLVLFKLP